MCSWKIILKTKGGKGVERKKKKNPLSVCQNCLESPLTSHCVLSVLPLHKSARGYDISHGVWALLQPAAEEHWSQGDGGDPCLSCLGADSRWGAESSSQLWTDSKGNALPQPTLCRWALSKPAYLEIPFLISFSSPEHWDLSWVVALMAHDTSL